jgi:threonine/homoserine/homoserine lactone efflux protein
MGALCEDAALPPPSSDITKPLQVPYLIAGVAIASIGSGLLCTISISTSTVQWAGFMVMTGIGIGIAQQLPYTAIQAVLE